MKWRREAGDTLIEVTLALTILSAVLAATTTLVVKAHIIGQVARERTTISAEAQHQAEQLRSFFQNHKWTEFLNGATTPTAYNGVLNAWGSAACHPTADYPTPQCFHMENGATDALTNEPVPMDGPTATDKVPTSYIEIVVTPDDPANPKTINYAVNYGFEGRGGDSYTGHVDSELAGLVPSGASPGGAADFLKESCDDPGGCGGPPAGGVYHWDKKFTNTSPPAQSVTGCRWDWGDGAFTLNSACNSADVIVHVYPSQPTAPYPADCWGLANYTVVLTEFLTSGGTATKTDTVSMPGCH